MPRPRPSLVARVDVVASEGEASEEDAPSGKVGMTVGTEGVMLACDEDGDECEDDRVSEVAMIDMVVVIGVSEDAMLEVELGSECEGGIHSEGFIMLLSVTTSDCGPLHAGDATGVITDTDATLELVLTHELKPGNISEEPASVGTVSCETVLEA